jgi:hypothetical protein
MLGVAVLALGAVILYAATGQLGRAVASAGSAFAHLIENVSSPGSSTRPSAGPVAGAPTLDVPLQVWTDKATVDLTGTVPVNVVGNADYSLNLYVTIGKQQPALVADHVPIPETANFTIQGVKLVRGTNAFTATLVGPGGESDPSGVASYVLDQAKPKVTITAPAVNAKVNGPAVDITGKTQAASTIVAHDDANGANATAIADAGGNFKVTIAIALGTNSIRLAVKDPAGNETDQVVSVVRGSGRLTIDLTLNRYSFSSKSSDTMIVTAQVRDPNGHDVQGAAVLFTVSLPGEKTVAVTHGTDITGTATFSLRVPKGLQAGKRGVATASTSVDPYGKVSATTPFTIYR